MSNLTRSGPPGEDTNEPPLLAATGPRRARKKPFVARFRPWLLFGSPLVIIAGLLLYPMVRVVYLSLHHYGLRAVISGRPDFVGLHNYRKVLGDSYLWKVVLPNTVVFAAATVLATLVLGTLVALLLERLGPRIRALVIGCAMVAWALPAVTGTYIWVGIFDPDDGVVRRLLDAIGLLGPEGVNWFTHRVSFYAIAGLNVVHHGYPFIAITIFAGLTTIPPQLHEAAKIDGAGGFRRFFSVTVPTIKPVFAIVTILSTIWDFKVFAQVYIMPGGSGSTPKVFNLGVWSYIESFGQNAYGLGSAIAVMLTCVLVLITIVYLRTMFKEDELT